ncbi:hypothetical protein Lfu02_78530 [Longispora fulva]|uniref:ADP-ribose pyrophosphatase YjhB (NUDIX family) n=1 Tax=Longispora fulva TaxID=619741 RepID=A0A8J7KMF2_9ACTN|nr:NUDIX domain-containing protein [Longispora fulva]MBG6133947.1 ADP-ribose pyrophosphatase YjhB (NUDIX family) [Longispora fulva]GIG63481.1 hypothetical protein Lfu02_78530 [Longispora fulva]
MTHPAPPEPCELRVTGRAVIIHDDRVLLTASGTDPLLWVLPGGGLDLGEHADAATAREVAEETGLEVEVEDMIMVREAMYPLPGDRSGTASTSSSRPPQTPPTTRA